MRLLIDTHTHTIHSGHATATVAENAARAAEVGLEAIVTTDHGPFLIGATRLQNLLAEFETLPPVIDGVRVYKGAEANIVDYYGEVDVTPAWLAQTDFMLASFHPGHIKPGSRNDYTAAVLGALSNPYVDVIAHPGNPEYPVDIEKVVLAAKNGGKMLEINNHSPFARKGSEDNCMEFLRLCKKHGVRVVASSDSHSSDTIGEFGTVLKMLKKAKFPDELVLNADSVAFGAYLEERRHRLKK